MEFTVPACPECRYDLRGLTSGHCPECGFDLERLGSTHCEACGAHELVRVRFDQPGGYERAVDVLDMIGVVVRRTPPSSPLGAASGLLLGITSSGYIWVDAADLDRAMDALEEASINGIPIGSPIVDRSEPVCPNCQAALDPNADPPCPSCGADFDWVDIGPPIDPDGPDEASAEEATHPDRISRWRRTEIGAIVIAIIAVLLVILLGGF